MDHTTPTATDAPAAIRARGAGFAKVLIEGAEIIDSQREVSAWLEEVWHRWLDIPVPTWTAYYRSDDHTWRPSLRFYAHDREEFESTVRALAHGAPKTGPGAVRKDVNDGEPSYVEAVRMFGSVQVRAWTSRENVCVRRVVGTEPVEVPDPAAPTITIDREIVEWDCLPVLTDGSDDAVAE
jgi:hypothetical protein